MSWMYQERKIDDVKWNACVCVHCTIFIQKIQENRTGDKSERISESMICKIVQFYELFYIECKEKECMHLSTITFHPSLLVHYHCFHLWYWFCTLALYMWFIQGVFLFVHLLYIPLSTHRQIILEKHIHLFKYSLLYLLSSLLDGLHYYSKEMCRL